MVVPKYPFPVLGGLERQAHELSKALAALGHTITVVSSRFERTHKTVERVEGIEVHRIPWFELKLLRFLLIPPLLFATICRFCRTVDVVHVHNITWFGGFATTSAKLLGLPVIAKLPNFGRFGISRERSRMFGWLRVILLRLCDSIVALSRESLQELQTIRFPADRVLKVPNGIVAKGNGTLGCARNTAKATLTVIFVGRLSEEKGLVDLFHVWPAVREQRPHVLLRLIGDGPERDRLRELASALRISSTVEFAGHRNDVPAELREADLFVLPSYAEGNSNAILEAMREGLPVVSTQIGGAPLQVGPEGAQFLFRPGDRVAMQRALVVLSRDDQLRSKIGDAMRTRVEQLFSMTTIARTYECAYTLLLSGRRHEIGELNQDLFQLLEANDLNGPTSS